MTMTMTRNHQHTPVLYPDDENFGTYTPTRLRASLPVAQRNGTNRPAPTVHQGRTPLPKAAAEEMDDDEGEGVDTDDLPDNLYQVSYRRPLSPSVRHNNTQTPNPTTNRSIGIQRGGHPLPPKPRLWGRPHRRAHGMLLVGVGMLLVMLIYSGMFWVFVGVLNVSNLASYGPTHTFHLDTQLGAKPSHIIATNVHGTIYVTIIEEQPGGKPAITTYVGPQLITSAWGDQADLDGIVPTVDVQRVQPPAFPMIYVHLTGNMDYWHFYGRPTTTFLLIPDKVGGYKVTL